jgi:hypothetical protein
VQNVYFAMVVVKVDSDGRYRFFAGGPDEALRLERIALRVNVRVEPFARLIDTFDELDELEEFDAGGGDGGGQWKLVSVAFGVVPNGSASLRTQRHFRGLLVVSRHERGLPETSVAD